MFACLAFHSAFAIDAAPNTVTISPRLVTSGQPNRAFLETLKSQGWRAFILDTLKAHAVPYEPL